ncbi:alpha-N-acetylgalactosaminidase-like [Ptychodera flava]|uniref:alpha-N-acetylgalactosaminidase-like n=1 Tax=Ptychodera flava TaxID=63121 RepID=UPI00396A778F
MKSAVLFLIAYSFVEVQSLDNGVALTPPMGWIVWERFRCNVDCVEDPDNCISERLFKDTIDRIASDGYRDAGYQYVNLDDCWMSHERDASGRLYANETRFPNGIKALVQHANSKGVKLGIYEDVGALTCAGYPGSLGHMQTDAQTFADWGIDYLKFDGCFSLPWRMDHDYPEMTRALNKTGRPIVFSCEWPWYQSEVLIKPNYTLIGEDCNLWRNFNDIQDSWESVLSVIDYYAREQDTLIAASGPGRWNDPDMLLVGDFGLSYDQSKVQMAMWSIFAAPLMMSNDLRTISPQARDILLNKEVIAIDQDPLGKMGRQVIKRDSIEVWTRPLSDNNYASVVLNRRTDGMPYNFTTTLRAMGVGDTFKTYFLRDVFLHQDVGVFLLDEALHFLVNPTGVVMVRASPAPGIRK